VNRIFQIESAGSYSYLPPYCPPFQRGDMGEIACAPPYPPRKISGVQSSRFVKAYREALHVNKESLMP
jgi:hypothetical protein